MSYSHSIWEDLFPEPLCSHILFASDILNLQAAGDPILFILAL